MRGGHRSGDLIDEYVAKYMQMLGAADEPPPIIQIRNNLGSKWLGRTTWKGRAPETTTIELQQVIVNHPATLERVVAHEIVHHVEALQMTEVEKRRVELGIPLPSHGRHFFDLAARINREMGDNFVSEKSDLSYEQDTRTNKPFIVLVAPPGSYAPHYAWAWAVRPSKKTLDWAQRIIDSGGKLVQSYDRRWTRGVPLKAFGGVSVAAPNSEDEQLLKELYEQS